METTASPSSSRAHRSVGPRLYGLLAGAVALAGLAGWFALYPLDRWMAGILVGGYGLLVAARPSLWLVLMPALWPVVDLAPWSGQIHVTESDALALATLAALGLREAVGRRLQSVVDVKGLHMPRPAARTGQQQRGGIGPAAECHGQRQARCAGRKRIHGLLQVVGVQAVQRGGHGRCAC